VSALRVSEVVHETVHTLQAVRHAKIETPRTGCHQGGKQEEVQLDNAANAVPWLRFLDDPMDLLSVDGVVHVEFEFDELHFVDLNGMSQLLSEVFGEIWA
jgi:hypothetical protein